MLIADVIVPSVVLWDAQVARWAVWVGLVVLTVATLLLIRTRWGQSQPLGKCIVLSLLAHLLIGIYATTVNIVTATVGTPDGKGIHVALVDGSSLDVDGNHADEDEPWAEDGDRPNIAAADLSTAQGSRFGRVFERDSGASEPAPNAPPEECACAAGRA